MFIVFKGNRKELKKGLFWTISLLKVPYGLCRVGQRSPLGVNWLTSIKMQSKQTISYQKIIQHHPPQENRTNNYSSTTRKSPSCLSAHVGGQLATQAKDNPPPNLQALRHKFARLFEMSSLLGQPRRVDDRLVCLPSPLQYQCFRL